MNAAVSAWAWHTPLGSDDDIVLRRLCAGERAVRANPRFDAGSYACHVAAALPQPPQPSRHQRFLRRMGLHAVEVAVQAWRRAALALPPERAGLFFGYGGLRAHWEDLMPAFQHQYTDGAQAWARGLTLLHPFWMLQHLSNNAQAVAAQTLDLRGEGNVYAGANASAQALAGALRALRAGAVDAALVVGYDSLIEPETLVELAQRGALTQAAADAVAAPYDRDARGFVPGEAAAALVLQRCEDAAAPLCRLQAAEGADGQAGEAGASTAARLLETLAQPGDALDGAGLAQVAYDHAERAAAAAHLGTATLLGCTGSAFGHLGAATAAVQAIALPLCLRSGVWPPVAGLRVAAAGPLCPLPQARASSARAAVGLSCAAPGLAGAVRVELP